MKAMNDVVTLQVAEVKRKNGIPETKVIQESECFARIESVKRNEFYEADREGVKLALSVYVGYVDFQAAGVEKDSKKVMPSLVEYEGSTYRIYRTYRTDDDEIELILQEAE